jgi:exosortase
MPAAARPMKDDQRQPLSHATLRHALSACLGVSVVAIFYQPLTQLLALALHDERSTHILVVPFISAFFIGLRRKEIFAKATWSPALGIPLFLAGIVLWFGLRPSLVFLQVVDALSATAALIVYLWVSVFLLCYGRTATRAAAFPLLFLLLMVPIPTAVIDRIVVLLQKSSAEVSLFLFRLAGVPVARYGFRFELPGVQIEIAEQCSSIRSSLSLFITGLIAGNLLLQATWKKVLLTLLTIPIAIFKNAVRIVTISWLGVYVSPDFFHGNLHQRGGLPFSLIALALLSILIVLFRGSVSVSQERSGSG